METLKNFAVEATAKLLAGMIFVVGVFACWIIVNIVIPPMEVKYNPPVQSLVFDAERCVGDDLIAKVILHKTEYINASYADFMGLTLRFVDPQGVDIPWFDYIDGRPVETKKNSENRPAGVSIFRLLLIGACGTEFMAHTEHRSPYTFMRLKMPFGPFVGNPIVPPQKED